MGASGDSSESGTGGIQIGRGGSRILAQAKEGRGSPDDANRRHAPCLEIIITIGYKKRASLPFVLDIVCLIDDII